VTKPSATAGGVKDPAVLMKEQYRRCLLSLLKPSIVGFVCCSRRPVGTKPELQWSECDQHHCLSYEASREREAVDPDKVRKATFRMRQSQLQCNTCNLCRVSARIGSTTEYALLGIPPSRYSLSYLQDTSSISRRPLTGNST
jgi:hypothetical protein